jgi:hypothetical protein
VARCSTPIFSRHLGNVIAASRELHITSQRNGIYVLVLVPRPQIFSSVCIAMAYRFRIFKTVCISPRHLIPESGRTASNRSSGCSVLPVRHTARFKVLPSKFALRRSLRVAQHRALPACQLLETRKRRWHVCSMQG